MLDPSPEFVVRAYFDAWEHQDIERASSYMNEDVQWRMHLGQDVVDFAGASTGRDALIERWHALRLDFELLRFEILMLDFVGQQARTSVRSDFRHKASGHVLDLTIRQVFRVEGREIVEVDEYHDTARIAAFMALAEQSAKSRAAVAPDRE